MIFAAVILKLGVFELTKEFFIGVFTSFIVGIFVIKFLMDFLKKGSFKIFAVYRVLIGLLVYVVYFVR